ncbi:hypothetical protein BJP34_11265 [Moorena producens PAL-8-15-08-1]|uniref:Uncharacterized protein n=1 Tax=Moorena producens PAL-8-15-08-1 TaxID=1458985 RepID=A0A1D8TR98_9CYAN|nr:hypothetical protein BJP34_11265 [Moorena producens PAL-8-15-08-1]
MVYEVRFTKEAKKDVAKLRGYLKSFFILNFAPLGRVFKLGDPPKSPLKKGDFDYGSPLF